MKKFFFFEKINTFHTASNLPRQKKDDQVVVSLNSLLFWEKKKKKYVYPRHLGELSLSQRANQCEWG